MVKSTNNGGNLSTEKGIPSKNLELERKKASQILHYLMERRQETEYNDPFDLLRNMNDVIQIYEPLKFSSNNNDEK